MILFLALSSSRTFRADFDRWSPRRIACDETEAIDRLQLRKNEAQAALVAHKLTRLSIQKEAPEAPQRAFALASRQAFRCLCTKGIARSSQAARLFTSHHLHPQSVRTNINLAWFDPLSNVAIAYTKTVSSMHSTAVKSAPSSCNVSSKSMAESAPMSHTPLATWT